VKTGTLSEKRIDESVLKILRIKASVGLDRNRFVDLAEVSKEVAKPENVAIAQQVADHAITLVSDDNHLVPLKENTVALAQAQATQAPVNPSSVVAVVFTDNARNSEGGRMFAHQLRQRVPDATVLYVDDANSSFIAPDVITAVANAKSVIALAEAVPSARRTTQGQAGGSVALDQNAAQLLDNIMNSARNKTIVVAFGNPYIGTQIRNMGTYLCTFSNTPTSAIALAKALFGEISIQGRLPVTIPGVAQRGAGMSR
jgi:beta-N-acetylhexosaminidase